MRRDGDELEYERISPEASSEPRILDFAASDQNYNLNPAEVVKMARIAPMKRD